MNPDEMALLAVSKKLEAVLKHFADISFELRGINLDNYSRLSYDLRKKVDGDLSKIARRAESLFQEHSGI